jgi:hypothetical protein
MLPEEWSGVKSEVKSREKNCELLLAQIRINAPVTTSA